MEALISDENLRRTLGQNGRGVVSKRFSVDVIVQQVAEALHTVAGIGTVRKHKDRGRKSLCPESGVLGGYHTVDSKTINQGAVLTEPPKDHSTPQAYCARIKVLHVLGLSTAEGSRPGL